MMTKRILQVLLAIIGSVAVITGSLGIVSGVMDDFYLSTRNLTEGLIVLDSNLRYFSGLWLGLGLVIFWMIPSIERHGTIFRLVSGMIFLGAIGRGVSMIMLGIPSLPFVFFTLLELAFPLLIFWQSRLMQSNLRPIEN